MQDQSTGILAVLIVVNRLAQATDDHDADAYAACLAPVIHDGVNEADARAYARAAIHRVTAMSWTHHQLMNPIVTIDRSCASAQIDVVIDLARRSGDGVCRHATIGGRYDLGFEKIVGEWRMGRRMLQRRYALGDVELAES